MDDGKTCPHCGKPVPPTVLGGICPECMLKAGLATQTEGPGGTGPHGTKVVPPLPKPEEIAPLFPQLEILECLGRGGMGVVYKARQPRLNRFVALKILVREKERDAQFAERFTREAQALARLNHPNIVTVYDFGTVGQASSLSPSEKAQAKSETGVTPVLHYLLMEFVDGLNLRQLLQTGKMPSALALAIVPKICEALQYAHEQNIVHRDIKPENILLDKSGRVKIADFGIAKMMGEETGQQTLTGAKEAVGTPHYMAPEQIEKPLTVDHRADIYSLGVVFYEMLTGELPLGKFQPPSAKVQIDVRLDEVVLHALEKEPDRRYQQASVLKTEVETIAAGTPRLENQSSKAENKPRLSDAAVVGACLAPFFFISMFFWDFGHLGGLPALRGIIISSLGFIAIIGTTILGWVAIGQIRRSEGRLCGMWLAVFDGLLFPVLVLDVGLLLGLLLANKFLNIWLLTRWYPVLAEHAFLNNPHFLIWLAITTALVIWIDYTIIRRIWRTVSKLTNQPSRPVCFNHAWRFAAVVFVIILSYQLSRTVFLQLIADHSHPVKSDYIGQAWFPRGDSIEITSVEQTENQMTVKGHYNLVSHDNAELALYITTTNDAAMPAASTQKMEISKGNGDFELIDPNFVPGLPHVSMYADGKPFAALYFGTQAEAVEENKAGWITNAPSASAEIWSPTPGPGDKVDLQKILQEAQDLMSQGRYEEALQRLIWYHNHSRSDPAQTGVRNSFALAYWVELGRHHPKAKQALLEIRDRDTQEFTDGLGNFGLFMEVSSINHYLSDDDATYELFKSLQQQDKALAQQCYELVQGLLIQHGEYDLCLGYLGDPQSAFERIRQSWERMKAWEDQQAATRQQRVGQLEAMAKTNALFANGPVPFLPELPKFADSHFVEQTCQLIEILVGAGQSAEAEKIRDEAVAALNEPRLLSAVRDAEEKTQKQNVGQPSGAFPDDAGQTVAGLPPVVVETFPVSGARDVAPGETEIRVRFSKEMTDGSWSWSTAWENSTPESDGPPHYLDDHRTCVMKVRLEPDRTYAWWLNSEKFKNFTDQASRPAVPYLLIFQTRQN